MNNKSKHKRICLAGSYGHMDMLPGHTTVNESRGSRIAIAGRARKAISIFPACLGHFILALIVIAGVATGAVTAGENLKANEYTGESRNITCWRILGVFSNPEAEVLWRDDLLAGNGLATEKSTDVQRMLKGSPASLGGTGGKPQSVDIVTPAFLDFKQIFNQPYERVIEPSAAYAAALIRCPRPTSCFILIGSSDATKLWCNGIQVSTEFQRRGLYKYSEVYPLRLQEGDNIILFKVVRAGLCWGLTARLEQSKEGAAREALLGHGMLDALLLRSCLLKSNEPLDLVARGVPPEAPLNFSVIDDNGHVLKQSNVHNGDKVSVNDLPDGIYVASLSVEGVTATQHFIKGSAWEIASRLREHYDSLRSSPLRQTGEPEALLRRLDLLKNEDITKDGRDRSLVWTISELSQVVRNWEDKTPYPISGLHLGSFISEIDGSRQFFRIYVPTTAKSGLTKMVVVLPTAISANRPFIESAFLKAHSEAERLSVLAEKKGLSLLWCGYRNQPRGAPCEFAHLSETIRAAHSFLEVDDNRIALFGVCGGGAIAMQACARNPRQFAAIALLNPVFRLDRLLTEPVRTQFEGLDGFKEWLLDTSTFGDFIAHTSVPIMLLHDGAEPGHGDLQTSRRFFSECRSAGYPIEFLRSEQTLSQHFGAFEKMIDWLSGRLIVAQERIRAEERRETNQNFPLSEAFTRSFVVVVGTGGSPEENRAIQHCAEQFNIAWRKDHFSDCRVVTDTQWRSTPLSTQHMSNLVLIGNPATNDVWRSIVSSDAIYVQKDRLVVAGNECFGDALCFQTGVQDNGGSTLRRIVLFGANDVSKLSFPFFQLSTAGWYHTAVWSTQQGQQVLIRSEPGAKGADLYSND